MDEFVTRKLAGVKGILRTSSVVVLRIVNGELPLSLARAGTGPQGRQAFKPKECAAPCRK